MQSVVLDGNPLNEDDTDAQVREWENAEKNNGFYPLGETPTLLP